MTETTIMNKKAQHRSWHTAKCNKLHHFKWNINAWDTAIPLHGRHFVRHLGICNPICIKLLQLMSGVITHNSVKNTKLINGWVIANYSFTTVILSAILEFIIIFASNLYNWCGCHYAQFREKTVSVLINDWVKTHYSVSRLPFCPPSWNLL